MARRTLGLKGKLLGERESLDENQRREIEEVEGAVGQIDGFLPHKEGEVLYHLARKCTGRGVIVEIGSKEGKSTICLAKGSKSGNAVKVYAVDPHTGSPEHKEIYGEVWTFEKFKKNIMDARVDDLVVPIVKTSREAAEGFDEPIELVFIDGAHEYDLVKMDFELWFPKVIEDGTIVFHDTNLLEPMKIVQEYVLKSNNFRNVRFVENTSLAIAEKVSQNTAGDRLKNRYLLHKTSKRDYFGSDREMMAFFCGLKFSEPAEVDMSVIIATLNRSDCLRKTLESIEKLKVSVDLTYEILLIDNASSDKTKELIDKYARKKPQIYKYFFEARKGKSNALNLGLRNARGKIIAFTDDDVVVDPDWLQELRDTFAEREDVLAIQGKILLSKEIGQLPPWVDPADLLFLTYYSPSDLPCYCDTLVGANMAFRREVFEKYGLFNPLLGPGASGFGEETELAIRIKEAGEKIFFQPSALIIHEYCDERLTWDYFWQRLEKHARTIAIMDLQSGRSKLMGLNSWRKLIRYYIKYYYYVLIRKAEKKHKYARRLHYLRGYIKAVAELRKSVRQKS